MYKLIFSIFLLFSANFANSNPIPFGAGDVSDRIHEKSYGCAQGGWMYAAGLVENAIADCDPTGDANGIPIGDPVKRIPQVIDKAAEKPVGTHRWWGSLSFYGEMKNGNVGDEAAISPDPLITRISDSGIRISSIPNGLQLHAEKKVAYHMGLPFDEIFEGVAIANSQHSKLNAYMKDYSDGSVTAQWRDGNTKVMEATLVAGSPYIYFEVFSGQALIRSKSKNGHEKGIYYNENDSLGMWTNVADRHNNFLFVGEGNTQFSNVSSKETVITSDSGRFTLVWLPGNSNRHAALPTQSMIDDFTELALNRVAEQRIDYEVDPTTYQVKITHSYLDKKGNLVPTMAGLMPMHWKNSSQAPSQYKTRSARGIVKYAQTDQFTYSLPYVGVLPSFPSSISNLNQDTLRSHILEYIQQGKMNPKADLESYWAGKELGKVAQLAAIARDIGMTNEADRLITRLKTQLQDWFSSQTDGIPDLIRYLAYDSDWNTVIPGNLYDEFRAGSNINDHHFHYGYFVNAAVEICRVDRNWCGDNQYGPMVDLLIRDYAGGRNDQLFPYLRHFDPFFGFSWADGSLNFGLGNNNESTSEAANAYGAIILYGMLKGDQELVERGVYLHSSTTAAYWEYWNNLDGWRGLPDDYDNFFPEYDKITTSIIWSAGADFATWFSPKHKHILGIQGLPLNPLVLHIGQHKDYLVDYITLGLKNSHNGEPSGLGLTKDDWVDIWWNIVAMADAPRALADFNSVNFNYEPEYGSSKAHTYQWLHTFDALGSVASGTKSSITANHPAAVTFEKNGRISYLAYNAEMSAKDITFSDGVTLTVAPNSFGFRQADNPGNGKNDTQPPSAPGTPVATNITQSSASLHWEAAWDNVGVSRYSVNVANQTYTTTSTSLNISGLKAATTYSATVIAEDAMGNISAASISNFTTEPNSSGGTNPLPYIQELDNGDVKYNVTYPQAMQTVQIFARFEDSDVQFLAQNISASETQNSDGSVSYSLIHPGENYLSGDQLSVRFYAHSVSTNTIFLPGPDDATWSGSFTYNGSIVESPPTDVINFESTEVSANTYILQWDRASDESGVSHYELTINGASFTIYDTTYSGSGETGENIQASIVAVDNTGVRSVTPSKLSFILEETTVPKPEHSFVQTLANGDVMFLISFPTQMQNVQIFARKENNSMQFLASVMNATVNGDGSFSYTLVHPAANYSSGDEINVRFYAYSSDTGPRFLPGPSDSTWSTTFIYP